MKLVNKIYPITTLMPRATELALQISENDPLFCAICQANH